MENEEPLPFSSGTDSGAAVSADYSRTLFDAALSYARNGRAVFPLAEGEKRPLTPHGSHDATTSESQICLWWQAHPTANIGMAVGERSGLIAIDVDNKGGKNGSAALASLEEQLGNLPETLIVSTPNNGRHYLFEFPQPFLDAPIKRELAPGVELKVNGYIVAPPSKLKNGGYSVATRATLAGLPERWKAACVKDEPTPEEWERLNPRGKSGSICKNYGIKITDVMEIPKNARRIRDGYLIKHPIHGATGDGNLFINTKLDLWCCYRCDSGGDAVTWIAMQQGYIDCSEASSKLDKTTFKRCLDFLRREGLIPEPQATIVTAKRGGAEEHVPISVKKHLTDVGNAERFVELYRDNVRYCEELGAWFIYDRRRWLEDKTRRIMHLARKIPSVVDFEVGLIDELPEKDKSEKEQLKEEYRRWARTSEFRNRLEAMLEQAKSFPEISMSAEQFDQDPCLRNFRNGTINLKTGVLRPHNPEDYITKLVPTDYDPEAKDERWGGFLQRVQPEPEARRFLQRAAGYSLTGLTSQEAVFFAYGPPASGKSTFLESLLKAAGSYGVSSSFSAFLAQRTSVGSPREDVARLRGARMVVCSEVNKNTEWNAALLKQLTSGDRVNARMPYAKYSTEFEPQFKLWLGANYRPKCDYDDDAVFRRFYIVRFDTTIPEDERDRALKDYLKNNEQAQKAVLAWQVAGAVEFFNASENGGDGLQAPPQVVAATREYQSSMNPAWEFISNECVIGSDPTAYDGATGKRNPYDEGIDELWDAYEMQEKHYDAKAVKSKRSLGKYLTSLGFESYRSTKDKSYRRRGLRLVRDRENAEVLRLVSDEATFPRTITVQVLHRLSNDLVYPVNANDRTQLALDLISSHPDQWLFGCLKVETAETSYKKGNMLKVSANEVDKEPNSHTNRGALSEELSVRSSAYGYLSGFGLDPECIKRELRATLDGLVANEQHDEKGQPLSNSQLRANFMAPSVLEAANQLELDVEQKRRLIAAARDIWNQVVSEKENEMNAQMAAPVLRLQAHLSYPIVRLPTLEVLNECHSLWARYSTKRAASLS
jgi:putative DNA primase/helicase